MYSRVALSLLAFGAIFVQFSVSDEIPNCPNKNLYLCTQCNTGCTACTACPNGWKLNPPGDGSYGCARCHPSCLECNVMNGVCVTCAVAGTGPSTDGTCASCGKSCTACSKNGAGRCDDDACFPGYGLDSNKMCAKCSDPNCASCLSDYNVCNMCKTGYQRSTQTNSCYPNGQALPTQYQIELSRRLQTGYSSTTVCPNLDNCAKCTNDGELCMTCRPTYGLVMNDTASGCKPCADTCALCSANVYQCTICKDKGMIPASDGSCKPEITILP